MSDDKALEDRRKRRSESVSAVAVDWANQFLKHLEMDFTSAAASLPAEVTWQELRQTMLRSFIATLAESGADPNEVSRLLQESSSFSFETDGGVTVTVEPVTPVAESDTDVGWTSQCNDRRIALIDKLIQQTLSAEEAVELDQLTARLRLKFDNEELVPLEGARQLHRRLLEAGDPESSTR